MHVRSAAAVGGLLIGLCQASLAQYEVLELGPEEAASPSPTGGVTLFQNVRIFDGKNAALSEPSNVLIRGNIIEQISASPAATEAGAGVRVINANGRVLMPATRIGTCSWRRCLPRSS
jgi:hypothetical protein